MLLYFSFEISMIFWSHDSGFASNFFGWALFYCLRVYIFFSFLDSLCIWNVYSMIEIFTLETHLLLQWFQELFVFPLCYQLSFFNYHFFYFTFTVVTSCHVFFSIVCTLKSIWTFISLVTCVVIFSAISANCFWTESCFCMSFLGQLWHIMGRYWYLYKAVSEGLPEI